MSDDVDVAVDVDRSGDGLSPGARRLCEAMTAGFPGPGDVAALRAVSVAGPRPPGPEVASVYDTRAGGVPVRVYDPAPGARRDRPLVVYLHGGGWVTCGLDTHDALCRELATGSGAVVVSVDYRLAPEHPWPAATDDALAVLLWARAEAGALGCDPGRVVVAGDSSGGNLAAVTALRAPGLVAAQLLAYPALDASMGSESVTTYGRGYFHTAAHMAWYWDQYGGDPAHPHVSPARAPDLSGLPRTLILLADCDLLRDEGLAYGRRLAAAGVDCEIRLYAGVFHGFLGLPLPAARAARAGAAGWVAGVLAPGSPGAFPA
ncbi:alpha/beta hydrolase [Streptomyces sp. RerS4]|uniref:alpha/beta hydrolase n=1 Tax=Streptomyces sp. RerS4 TaxID=2942449 RepID=UPI00201C6E15|nr:alpha/beta hydrolase [Streptomyces sp. RerS4]UQX00694.1 alpha/beta hydrolase [Streptomyces sp. RerS4]